MEAWQQRYHPHSRGVAQPDYITELHWWSHPSFADGGVLRAAEHLATERLGPILASQDRLSDEAKSVLNDPTATQLLRDVLSGKPTGTLQFLSLEEAIERLADLERRVAELEVAVATQQ